MKFLKYLYYRFYRLMVSVGNGDIAEFASIMLFTFIFFLNIHVIEVFIYKLSAKKIYLISSNKFIILAELLMIAVFLYFILVFNGKSNVIIKHFENETKKEQRFGRITVLAYIAISIVLLILSFLLLN